MAPAFRRLAPAFCRLPSRDPLFAPSIQSMATRRLRSRSLINSRHKKSDGKCHRFFCFRMSVVSDVLLSDQSTLYSPNSGRSTVSCVELAKNVLNVLFNRLNTDVQRMSNFSVAEPQRDMTQDLQFAIR